METAERMYNPVKRTMITLNHDKTEDLDDTLPIELLNCVDTTTNNDWLTRETPLLGKVNYASVRSDERFSAFNPPLSSTRYKSDGSSSEFSDVSTTAECGSAYEDEILSAASQKNSNFTPPFLPAASMEFQPLRCSTAVTTNELVALPSNDFEIRVDTCELKSLREKQQLVQRAESIEFNPLRCSTGLTADEAALKPRPTSPEEFYSARNNFSQGNTVQENDTHFVTALGMSQGDSYAGAKPGRQWTENAKSPTVQVSKDTAKQDADLDTDLSILMQYHLKIRNGRQIISNFQAKSQIEFSVFKDSPLGTATVPDAFQTKPTSVERKNKIPSKVPSNQNHDNSNQRPSICNRINSQPGLGESRAKLNVQQQANFVSPSSIPTMTKLFGPDERGKSSRGNSPGNSDGRKSPEGGTRVQRAVENLASSNVHKVVFALATLDSARSAHLCETLVEQHLIDNIYDFLTKMNRSIAHQVACVHATSLLLDLAKYHYSTESTWQNGNRVGLLFTLMSIWVSKDNAIFLNCATLLWVFCQDKTRANVLRRFLTTQPKLLEKISVKVSTKLVRPATKVLVPTLMPSWTNLGQLRTFENPCSAFSGLSTALKS